MARLLGDANPELAKRFGLDSYQREQLEEELEDVDRRVKIVTFREPPPRDDGKDDPIAYLPPRFETYGILDRDHRHRASPGETWFVEVIDKSNAFFLIPLAKFDISQLGDFLPNLMDQLADRIAKDHPDVVADRIGEEHDKKLETAQQEVQELEAELEAAKEEIGVQKAKVESLEAELEEEKAKPRASKASPSETKPSQPEPATTPARTAPAQQLDDEGIATREHGDVLSSTLLTHQAYEARFTLDLSQLHLRPSKRGEMCIDGSLEVPGLARADPEAAPRRYPVQWSDEIDGFIVRLNAGAPAEEDPA